MIVAYESWIDEVLARLRPDNIEIALRLATIPEEILGFDTIKDAAMHEAASTASGLLQELRAAPDRQVSQRPLPDGP